MRWRASVLVALQDHDVVVSWWKLEGGVGVLECCRELLSITVREEAMDGDGVTPGIELEREITAPREALVLELSTHRDRRVAGEAEPAVRDQDCRRGKRPRLEAVPPREDCT